MAKKTAKKKATATKANKKASAKKTEHVEIELDPIETKAIELAHGSAKVQKELEEAATLAMSLAVRKVFKQRGVSLTQPQAQEVAAFLFSE
jgi:dGTP triphosphohydrolase